MAATTKTFLSFFTNPGLHFVGAKIAENLKAEDLVALMQVKDDLEHFVLENQDIRRSFVTKAQFECYHCSNNIVYRRCGNDSMDYILDDPKDEQDERKMKVAVLQFKLLIQFRHSQPRCPSDFVICVLDFDQTRVDIFTKEFKKLLDHLLDSELVVIFSNLSRLKHHDDFQQLQIEFLDDLLFLILNKLKDKTHVIPIYGYGGTVLHHLVKPPSLADEAMIQKYRDFLKTWIQSLPGTEDRCPIDNDGDTPLHYLSRHGTFDIDMLKTLCQTMTKNQIGLQNQFGFTALHHALDTENPTFEFILVLSNAMTKDHVGLQDDYLGQRQTPLHLACAEYHGLFQNRKVENTDVYRKTIHLLCKILTKAKVGLQDGYGQTALHYVCNNIYGKHCDIIQILCESMRKKHIALQDHGGNTPLHNACSNNNCTLEVLQILCRFMTKKKIGLQDKEGRTPLHTFCLSFLNRRFRQHLRPNVEIAKLLCQSMTRRQLGLQDSNGRTALHEICSHWNMPDKVGMVQVLCQHLSKDQIVLHDNAGKTPLHDACSSGYYTYKVIEVLCQNMAEEKVGLQDQEGNTPLHFLCANEFQGKDDVRIVKLLCDYMTRHQVGLTNKQGRTALHQICSKLSNSNNAEIAQVLCQHLSKIKIPFFGCKSKISLQDNDGKTALHLACAMSVTGKQGTLEVIDVLGQKMTKYEVELEDKQRRYPIKYVSQERKWAVYECLPKVD